jgi:Helix-turn-helix family
VGRPLYAGHASHEATGDLPEGMLQASRAWPDDDWNAARSRMNERGWLTSTGALTAEGRAARDWVEMTTDQLMLRCWEPLGEAACRRLRRLVRPHSRVISAATLTLDERARDE